MYAKTNPKAGHLSPRQKRIFAITAVVVVALFGGLAAWGATAHDSYGASGHGCVNVTVPAVSRAVSSLEAYLRNIGFRGRIIDIISQEDFISQDAFSQDGFSQDDLAAGA